MQVSWLPFPETGLQGAGQGGEAGGEERGSRHSGLRPQTMACSASGGQGLVRAQRWMICF